MKTIAIILAAGYGIRFDENRPKQLLKVAGKTVLEHSIDAFEKTPGINEIAIVINPEIKLLVDELIVKNKWKKVMRTLNGGEQRHNSSISAICAYSDYPDDTNMIFHDGTRPLVDPLLITALLEKMREYDAVTVSLPAGDAMMISDASRNEVVKIPERKYMYRMQTPQGVKLGVIRKAYELGMKDPAFNDVEECGVVLHYQPHVKIASIPGDQKNIKLTFPEDAYLLDKLFQIQSINIKDKLDKDALKDKVIVVFGGNTGIGADIIKIASLCGSRCHAFSRHITRTDITNQDSIKKILADVDSLEGKIDFVVNTAAVLIKVPLMVMDEKSIRNTIETNYYGNINIAMAAYPYLKKTKGHLLLFTSSSYTRGRELYSLYSSTKAAVVNFTQAIAEEWEHDGIHINCICPERTKTPMRVANFGVENVDTLLKSENVAKVSLLALLSDINGQVVDVKVRDFAETK